MKREARLIIESQDGKKAIYFDVLNGAAITDYLESSNKHRKRFRLIKTVIFDGLSRHESYKYEGVDDVYAMRFDLHAGNGRIYCKQVYRNGKIIIIAAELLPSKKSEANGPVENSIINRVSTYEYNI